MYEAVNMEITNECEQLVGVWMGRTLAAKLRKPKVKSPIFKGEESMDDEEELDLSNLVDPLKIAEWDLAMPVIDFPLEECQQMWKLRRKALILKPTNVETVEESTYTKSY